MQNRKDLSLFNFRVSFSMAPGLVQIIFSSSASPCGRPKFGMQTEPKRTEHEVGEGTTTDGYREVWSLLLVTR